MSAIFQIPPWNQYCIDMKTLMKSEGLSLSIKIKTGCTVKQCQRTGNVKPGTHLRTHRYYCGGDQKRIDPPPFLLRSLRRSSPAKAN